MKFMGLGVPYALSMSIFTILMIIGIKIITAKYITNEAIKNVVNII